MLVTGLLSITLLGGCPVQQQPATTADDEDPSTVNQDDSSTDTSGDDRPIPPPPLDGEDEEGEENQGEQQNPDTGDGTTPEDETGGGNAYLGFTSPFDAVTVRPPGAVNIVFNLALDYRTSVAQTEIVVARDDNADRAPDGDPVYVQIPAVAAAEGVNTYTFGTQALVNAGLVTNDYGRFVLGIRIRTTGDMTAIGYAAGTVTIDAQPPVATWIGAGPQGGVADQKDHLVTREGIWEVSLTTDDTSPHTVTVLLDPDTVPLSGNEVTFVEAGVTAGLHTFPVVLATAPLGKYYYYVMISDGIDPPVKFYAPRDSGGFVRLRLTDRLVGEFPLSKLTSSIHGAILQGFNFNDLAGSSMVSVPDMTGDGASELLIGARYGKPNLSGFQGQGWGEAYMIYGNPGQRLHGIKYLNSTGTTIPGVTFRGIRVPQNTNYTEGLSDIAVVPDMDGDNLAELVFSFPRVESLTLESPAFVEGVPYQHPELVADVNGMGRFEFDAIDYNSGAWVPDQVQFARGGIVIVSSHNEMLQDSGTLTRKFDRVLDLHEVGEMFDFMVRPSLAMYMRDLYPNPAGFFGCEDCIEETPEGCVCGGEDPDVPCEEGCDDCGGIGENPDETEYQSWVVAWDVWLGGG
ncbi:MAG: hypothetical protein PVJ57_17145 [Phycisphaerae bacterium]